MKHSVRALSTLVALGLAVSGWAVAQEAAKPGQTQKSAEAQKPAETYKPVPFMPGRDVVWVPTPDVLVESMLDLAGLTPKDVAVDLGSGDGRIVIAAAKRGATARGVEFNPELVALSRQRAAKAGVADRATFVEGDMFEADFSDATVMPLFLLPENMTPLVPKFLKLRPGSRIVINEYRIDDWDPDRTVKIAGDCGRWCVAHLYIVPAQVEGVWQTETGELRLKQRFQMLTGTLTQAGKEIAIEGGRLEGANIRFSAGGERYTGEFRGGAIAGRVEGKSERFWTAQR